MSRLRLVLAFALGVAGAGCALLPDGTPLIRVLVFNIHAGKDAAGAPNLDGVAALVRSSNADIVLLQEVDRHTRRSGGVDQVQVLQEKTGFDAAFGRSLNYDGGQYGIAVLAPRVATSLTAPLRVTPPQARSGGSYEPRVAMTLTLPTAIGRLQAINTHLDASAQEDYRLQESAEILQLVGRLSFRGLPLIAGGDFNAEPTSETYRRLTGGGLRDAWIECGAGDGLTYPADKPIKRIDYVFLSAGIRCTKAEVIDTQISDHRPLLVTVTTQ